MHFTVTAEGRAYKRSALYSHFCRRFGVAVLTCRRFDHRPTPLTQHIHIAQTSLFKVARLNGGYHGLIVCVVFTIHEVDTIIIKA